MPLPDCTPVAGKHHQSGGEWPVPGQPDGAVTPVALTFIEHLLQPEFELYATNQRAGLIPHFSGLWFSQRL